MINNKAIGAVVATSLLLVVAVAAIVGFQSWYQTFSSETFGDVEQKSSDSSSNSGIETVVGNDIYFKNGFEENVTIISVKIGNNDCGINGSYGGKIESLSLGNNCTQNLTTSTPDVIMTTDKGVFVKRIYLKNVDLSEPVISYSSCTLDGITVNHDENYTFYNSSLVPFGSSCSNEIRVCNDGTYGGNTSFNYSSCSALGQDTMPDAFSFTDLTDVAMSSLTISNTVIPTGFDGPLSVGITGDGSPQLSINGGSWVTSGQMNLTDNLTIRLTSSSSSLTLSLVNITLGNYSTIWNVTTKDNPCLSLAGGEWVLVPGNAALGTSDFCVMKYEPKNVGGVPTSQPSLSPWVSITQTTAKTECESLGTGYHLISNAEWTTIAREAEANSANWDSGTVGSGSMFKGHSDGSPNNALAASSDDNDGYYGTGNVYPSIQKRTLELSNGEIIWDLSGNVWEWNSNVCSQGDPWFTGTAGVWYEWTDSNVNGAEKNLAGPLGNYNSVNSMGKFYGCYTNGNGFFRGGDWKIDAFGGTYSGVYALYLGIGPSYSNNQYGFRCAYTP